MRVHYLQHVPFEGLGSIQPWLDAAGCAITTTPLFESSRLPGIGDFDWLIVMGGPMSVNDADAYPWLTLEKELIRDAIAARKRVLGICLGAQLIANVMGAEVHRNPFREIGWFPVQGLSPSDGSIFRFPSSFEAFHWHGETFNLPPDAIQLARTEACENQAFQFGPSVIGLQFHLETTPLSAQAIVSHCRAELTPAQYIQGETAILAAASEKYQALNDLMGNVLSFLHASKGHG
jgi:GMP synthase-like glutamine amidotransferase